MLNLLHFHISTFRSVCAVPNMAVFCSSLISCFPGMLLSYFLNDFEMVQVAPIITGITFVFTFHMSCISIVRSSYFRIFSASFFITFLFPQIATSISTHVSFSLSRIMILVYCQWWFCQFALVVSTIWLPCLVSTNSVASSYHCSLYQFTPVSMHMLKCSWAHTQSCLFMYCYFAKIGHADIMRSIISSNCWHSLFLFAIYYYSYLLLRVNAVSKTVLTQC